MATKKITYVCQQCGWTSPKWTGRCAECGAWNSLEETRLPESPPRTRSAGYSGTRADIYVLDTVETVLERRIPTGLSELDRVLGGGLVPGSVVLIGGDPGIGKSTLLLQALATLSQYPEVQENSPVYVTGEESPQQISARARRLNLNGQRIKLVTETQMEAILMTLREEKPSIIVIDSIQTVYTDSLSSAPGSVTQVRECAAQLVRFAKQANVAVFLVGHVTKEGALAGPRVLEHMVDTVLYFEGDSGTRFRVIRAIKNRFGAVNELGVFAMTDRGLKEVSNPSALFLSHHEADVAGSVIMVTWEGSRPLLVEVQALVDESHMPNPRRVTVGLDQNRLAMLLAVLHRHGGVATYNQDVFVNVVGGVRVNETGADLAVLGAVLSSLRNAPLPKGLVVFGEVGLAGEIRPVPNGLERLREAEKHGFNRAIVPKTNVPKNKLTTLEVVPVVRLVDALHSLYPRDP